LLIIKGIRNNTEKNNNNNARMSTLSVTAYVVNTMTVTAHSGRTKVDLGKLRLEQAERAAGDGDCASLLRVSHFSCRDGDEIVRVGRVFKRNGREKRYSSKLFDNQSTVVVRMPYDGGYYINIKIFHNGKLQMTGARTLAQAEEAANFALGSAGGAVRDATVHLMNSNFVINKRINREELHDVASNVYCVRSSFNPSVYPGVKIYFMYNQHLDGRCRCETECSGLRSPGCCKRITVLVFSGKAHVKNSAAIITGATCDEQIKATHEWLSTLLIKHAPRVVYS
jgi:hypothetical protein